MEKHDTAAIAGGTIAGFLAIKPVLIGPGPLSEVSAPGVTRALAAIGYVGYRGYKYLKGGG